jgi:HK97 family phage portal protein
MKILGFHVSRRKALSPVRATGGWWGIVRESFPGAWQRNVEVETGRNLLAFSAVFACVSIISQDISKLRIKLLQRGAGDIWTEVRGDGGQASAFLPVLRKPNPYQTRIQFLMMWVVAKLLTGNAYILKERDQRNVVRALHVLDSSRVTPLVTESGDVYYELKRDDLAGQAQDRIVVPASEVIHDRGVTLWHPLVGVSPIYACGASATQGIRIQANSAKFFENMSRPSGQLTAPGTISDATAVRLKEQFEANFTGGNLGRLLVAGDGLKYEAMTIPANDAQLIEQLRWTVEDVARCFHVPLHKIASGQNPTFNNIGAFNQDYYSQTLQALIESIELLLDEGLALPAEYGTELDTDAILRLDPLSRADLAQKAIGAGYMAPNEARARENLPPVPGGESCYLQQQNYSLEALANRPAPDVAAPAPAAPAAEGPDDGEEEDDDAMREEEARAFAELFVARLNETAAA